MDIRIKMNLDNAAFEEDTLGEVERILTKLTLEVPEMVYQCKVSGVGREKTIMDINGNSIGKLKIIA